MVTINAFHKRMEVEREVIHLAVSYHPTVSQPNSYLKFAHKAKKGKKKHLQETLELSGLLYTLQNNQKWVILNIFFNPARGIQSDKCHSTELIIEICHEEKNHLCTDSFPCTG